MPTMAASYKLWPAAHLVNFALVPPAYRVLYTNLVSVSSPPADTSLVCVPLRPPCLGTRRTAVHLAPAVGVVLLPLCMPVC